jgi:hypothetical protein
MPLRTLFIWVSVMLVVVMHMCVRVCMYVYICMCVCIYLCVCVVGPHAHMGLSSLMCVGGTPVKRVVERTQLWHDRACPCWFPRRAGCRPRHRRNHAEQPYVRHALSLSLSLSLSLVPTLRRTASPCGRALCVPTRKHWDGDGPRSAADILRRGEGGGLGRCGWGDGQLPRWRCWRWQDP